MNEIKALTGLRGIAALIVFWFHLKDNLAARGLPVEVPTVVERLFFSGGRQVDIFFVLSGFILALIYKDWFSTQLSTERYRKFLLRRFARIYPLHAFMLVLTVGAVVAAAVLGASTENGLERFRFATLPEHFLLIQAWGIVGEGPGEWNPPAWSVSIEALAYLLFPFFLLALGRLGAASQPWPWLAGMIVLGFGLNALTTWEMSGFGAVVRGLSEFALGCLVAMLYDQPIRSWLQTRTGSFCALALLVVGFALVPGTGFVIGVLTAPLLLSLCGDNPVSRMFAWRPIAFLGDISYSVYLGHFLFSSIAYRLFGTEWMAEGPWQLACGVLLINAFVLGVSTLTYRSIEIPARDWLSGRRKPRPASPAEAPG